MRAEKVSKATGFVNKLGRTPEGARRVERAVNATANFARITFLRDRLGTEIGVSHVAAAKDLAESRAHGLLPSNRLQAVLRTRGIEPSDVEGELLRRAREAEMVPELLQPEFSDRKVDFRKVVLDRAYQDGHLAELEVTIQDQASLLRTAFGLRPLRNRHRR